MAFVAQMDRQTVFLGELPVRPSEYVMLLRLAGSSASVAESLLVTVYNSLH